MSGGAHVGIDLGTTYSLVAVLEEGEPRVLRNALGEVLTPSAVSIEGDTVLVGAAAAARAATAPELTARFFKRDMGTDRVVRLGNREFRPEQLSALVLATLKQDAEAALGRPVEEAVVTVPAYFGELQRRATRNAAEIAGLRVERIINEPTAAALAYGLHNRAREFRAAVLDLGGGTFDVTVLEVLEGVVEIQSSAGDARLGGEDFADALAELAAREVEARHGSRPGPGLGAARIREAAEVAKRALSTDDHAVLALPMLPLANGRSVDAEIRVDRARVEAAWAELLRRVELPIQRALHDARATAKDVDEVLLVGGATRTPCVQALVARLFGRLPLRTLPPDEAVALGAAVQAGLKAGDEALDNLVVTDVAPFSLGIETATRDAQRLVSGLFTPILERGTVLPASRVERFSTMEANQTAIKVKVYQGEHSICQKNTKLGEYEVKGLPKSARGEESIDVRFTYDLNGILEVESMVVSTGKTATLVIESAPGRLGQKEIAEARKAMRSLKFHPREALPNVTVLARADALYAELTSDLRAHLGRAIQEMRLVLESQDARRIAAARAELASLVESLRRTAR